jgi:nucleoside-diphosphate-sugar epimerase
LKILLTGSTGFYGKAILARLKNTGHHVIGAASLSNPSPNTDYLNVSSLENCKQIFSKYEDIDVVIHCAAIAHASPGMFSDNHYYKINALGTKNIIDTAIDFGVKKFIMISSVSVYGEFDLPDVVTEEADRNPFGPYGNSKKVAEDICFKRKNEINLYIFRMTSMYGDDWLDNIRRKIVPPVIGKFIYLKMDATSHRYSFCSNKNGADAILWAIENKIKPDIYNIADYYVYCLDTVLNVVKKAEGNKIVLKIPRILPVLMLKIIIMLTRNKGKKANMKNRYWKFFKNNIYSTEKLESTGFYAHPYLLDLEKEKKHIIPTLKNLNTNSAIF